MNKTLYRFAYRTFDLSERKANVFSSDTNISIAPSLDWLSNICIKRFHSLITKRWLRSVCWCWCIVGWLLIIYLQVTLCWMMLNACLLSVVSELFVFSSFFVCRWTEIVVINVKIVSLGVRYRSGKIIDIALCYPGQRSRRCPHQAPSTSPINIHLSNSLSPTTQVAIGKIRYLISENGKFPSRRWDFCLMENGHGCDVAKITSGASLRVCCVYMSRSLVFSWRISSYDLSLIQFSLI